MGNIIKSDLYRIFKGKAIYIVMIVIIVLSLISAITMQAGQIGLTSSTSMSEEEIGLYTELSNAKSIKEFRDIMAEQGEFQLDQDVIGTNNNLYYIFIVVVVIVLTTDFSTKSIKNTLSSSISRRKYYVSKVALIFILSTAIVLFNNYFFYFINILINGTKFASTITHIFKLTIIQLPLIYGIISLLICIAFVVKKTSIFNTLSIPLQMIIQIIAMACINIFKIKANWFFDYELQYALTKLVNNPSTKYIISCALLGLVYIIVFNCIAYTSFKRTEIK